MHSFGGLSGGAQKAKSMSLPCIWSLNLGTGLLFSFTGARMKIGDKKLFHFFLLFFAGVHQAISEKRMDCF